MLFAITLACSDEVISFDSPTTKNNSNVDETEENNDLIEDISLPVDSGDPIEEDDGIVDIDDIMDIFQKYSCQGCHGSSGGFRLNESELKNGTSTATGAPYIVSGMPQQSYLYLKIVDAGGIAGQPMPIGVWD